MLDEERKEFYIRLHGPDADVDKLEALYKSRGQLQWHVGSKKNLVKDKELIQKIKPVIESLNKQLEARGLTGYKIPV